MPGLFQVSVVLVSVCFSTNRFTKENDTPEFARIQQSLKRISIARSPNGSLQFPDRSGLLDYECGTGLTPMLTRALRKKFQVSLLAISLIGLISSYYNVWSLLEFVAISFHFNQALFVSPLSGGLSFVSNKIVYA